MKKITTSLAIAAFILAPMGAFAHGNGNGHGHDKGRGQGHHQRHDNHDRWDRGGHHYSRDRVIVVQKGYHHRGPAPRHRYYHRSDLAKIATFAVLAGVTYAIVDNVYYQQRGERYEYVSAPPAGSYRVVDYR
ncbi:hypothetical protein [Gallaecimonas pentaromativorans]|uniref:hypothetical protein n=1 Tax=Gallaecimonas pentaromativorans TaxID=584787 RepID=UPI00067F6759|nr:hypothetical protein [Gallaecimonas pentaromativorans]MED5524787.1 hypothetical protein [Pseudomonadota bacterium]